MNSIFTIEPTRSRFGVWSFDDASTELVGEPFVGETNVLIDKMVEERQLNPKRAARGVCVFFSHLPFPDYQVELILEETSQFGSTYRCDKFDLNPWLCPALFKYFPSAPDKLYASVKG